MTCRLQTPQGERTLSSVKFPLRDDSGRRYVGSITRDVTEQRAAEEALRDADRRKDEFLATLAHELRNPLAPIRTRLAILGRAAAAERRRAWSRAVIERQVAHMVRLVDDLLDVSRVTSGKLVLRTRARRRWRGGGRRALETSRPAIEAARPPAGHARCRPRRPCSTPIRCASRRCSSNLLNNAAKYTAPGGAHRG